MAELSAEMTGRVEALLGDVVTSAAPIHRGYTPAGRWRVELRSGSSVFVKAGATTGTAEALRLERDVYAKLRGPFMPHFLAWEDHPLQPLMVLEDLSTGRWPPPWDAQTVEEVRAALKSLHASRAPLKTSAELHGCVREGWQKVAMNPEPFLGLGLVTRAWLDASLTTLIEASADVNEAGNEVIHLDVRSDNLCRATRGIILIDWNWACLGNGALDTGFWLPSLEAEGGPTPEETLPGRPDIAACVSGFFAARAGLPAIPDAPHVRAVQRQQLGPALRWAARELELPHVQR